jgi:hypothetical protein
VEVRKAYDTLLQSEVSADLAARSGGFEMYRYECVHCSEEVRLAAATSTSMVPHFRHRSGNNDIECEKYLGQYGAINPDYNSRNSRNERAEFYFDSNTKMFSLGLCFNENEIAMYQEANAVFEMRVSTREQAFYTLSINDRNFLPDMQRAVPIEKFSFSYYLSNTLNNINRKYNLFKKDATPIFFKIQGDSSTYRAKMVRSTILYTGVTYFVARQTQYSLPQDYYLPSEIETLSAFRFETMGRKFLGKILTIKNKTTSVDSLVTSWGYQLEASETLTLLWPPASQRNDIAITNSGYVYLFSSFILEPHGNINVHPEDIKRCTDDVSRVSIYSKVKVYRKNAEIEISNEKTASVSYDALPITETYTSVYEVPDDNIYYLFNQSGVTTLSQGQEIFLTPGSFVRSYQHGYLDEIIYPERRYGLTGESLLKDILAHYKRTEPLSLDAFASLEFSELALTYIEKCIEAGVINSAAKRLIEEGRL